MKFFFSVGLFYKILFILIILFFGNSFLIAKGNIREQYSLAKKCKQLEADILITKKEIVFLKKKERKLKSDSVYLDRVIRKKLGVAKKEEIIFVFQSVK